MSTYRGAAVAALVVIGVSAGLYYNRERLSSFRKPKEYQSPTKIEGKKSQDERKRKRDRLCLAVIRTELSPENLSTSSVSPSATLLSVLPSYVTKTPLTWLPSRTRVDLSSILDPVKFFLPYLSLDELCRLATVCKLWNQIIFALIFEPKYLENCARHGFIPEEEEGKHKDGRLRGGCWKVASRSHWLASDEKLPLQQKEPKEASPFDYKTLVLENEQVQFDIEKDACRTVIHHDAFSSDTKRGDKLLANILSAYAAVDPEVGYCQGMNFVAAQFLTFMDETDAFWSFYTLLQHPSMAFRSFFYPGLKGLLVCKFQFTCLLRYYLPDLASEFDSLGLLEDDNYNTPWFMTLFTKLDLPMETMGRIWDLLLTFGAPILHQTGLAILDCVKDNIQGLSYEDTFMYLRTLPDKELLTSQRILSEIRKFPVSFKLLHRLQDLWVEPSS